MIAPVVMPSETPMNHDAKSELPETLKSIANIKKVEPWAFYPGGVNSATETAGPVHPRFARCVLVWIRATAELANSACDRGKDFGCTKP